MCVCVCKPPGSSIRIPSPLPFPVKSRRILSEGIHWIIFPSERRFRGDWVTFPSEQRFHLLGSIGLHSQASGGSVAIGLHSPASSGSIGLHSQASGGSVPLDYIPKRAAVGIHSVAIGSHYSLRMRNSYSYRRRSRRVEGGGQGDVEPLLITEAGKWDYSFQSRSRTWRRRDETGSELFTRYRGRDLLGLSGG